MSRTQTTDLTIIILNYNTADWVSLCLQSLKKYVLSKTKYSIEVVVVDNNSSDDSVTQIKKEFGWVKLIESKENLGFAGGNNLALTKVNSRYAMLLNSDTEATQKTHFDDLLSYLDEHPQVAVISPRVELPTGELDMASHRGEPTPWASLTYFAKLEKLFPHWKIFAQYHQTYKDFTRTHEIDACSGAAMIVKKSAMDRVGLLDDLFFMYAEDLDWCRRFREAGYRVVYYPNSVIIHHKYKSGLGNKNQKLAQKTSIHFYETMLQYYDKHYRHHYPFWMRWIVQAIITLKKGGV